LRETVPSFSLIWARPCDPAPIRLQTSFDLSEATGTYTHFRSASFVTESFLLEKTRISFFRTRPRSGFGESLHLLPPLLYSYFVQAKLFPIAGVVGSPDVFLPRRFLEAVWAFLISSRSILSFYWVSSTVKPSLV